MKIQQCVHDIYVIDACYYSIFYQQHPQASQLFRSWWSWTGNFVSERSLLKFLSMLFVIPRSLEQIYIYIYICITKIHKFSWENGIRYWFACIAANKQREGLDFPALGAAQILAHWSEVAECISAQGRGLKDFSICRAEAGDTSILCVCVFSVCCRFCTLFSLWFDVWGCQKQSWNAL